MLLRIFPFLHWLPNALKQTWKADMIAGLTGAIIVLPQGVAYAMIAGLPPEYGLYTCIIPAIIAALFGSSHHLISGSTAALSVIVFTTISQFALPGSPLYIQMALTLTFCAGILQILFGLMRFGAVVNFVSHSVVLGFTAGAAIVIAVSQLKNLLGIDVESGSTAFDNLLLATQNITQTHIPSLLIGLLTIFTCLALKKWAPKLPNMLLAMIASILGAQLFSIYHVELTLVGHIPSQLPSLSTPNLETQNIERMSMGIVAVALLGLVEAISIARSVALKSGQMINANQEFIGQGLSNLIGSFFSCYVSSGSFTRSGVNYTSGAKSPLAAIFAAFFLSLILLFFAPYAAYIPIAGMAGILFVVSYNLIDFSHIYDIYVADKKEFFIVVMTFISALVMHLELSIYVGVALSLFFYLRKTSTPAIDYIDPASIGVPHDIINETQVIRLNGSLFYGSTQHVQKIIQSSTAKHIFLIGQGVNFIDYTGGQMLSDILKRGDKTLYFCQFEPRPIEMLKKGHLGKHFSNVYFYNSLCDVFAQHSPKASH